LAELKPWLEVASPHDDIRDGSFDESLFAADLGLVATGRGPRDYLDPELFAQKTFLTQNLKAALVEVGNRLAGEDVAAVFRMQTEFGGGKTHTLLAAYHLFGSPSKVSGTRLGRELAGLLKGGVLPSARVAVLDGSAMRPDPEEVAPGIRLSSFLGHLAWRLGGADLYERVRAQDDALLGTSTVQMVELLEAAAPCLVLLDETLEYLNKALEVRTHDGSLAATTLTVIKELCTAASNVKGAAVVATLTSSRLEDYASVSGQEMQERLSKVVGRTENIVTPVEGDDIFPILHTRLFESVGDPAARRAVADAYGSHYESLGDVLPSSLREPSYRDRIEAAYPFHPELIDILTNRWGSLSGFQRTRGALRTLAHTVKALAQRNHQGPLIHPGDVLLADAGVRAEVIRFAGESFKSALNADIIRPDSKAAEEDRRRGGEVEKHHIAVGLATTAFLNSFGADKVLGASAPQMLLGVARPNPGLSRGVLDDVRDALAGSLWYMRYEGGRYRFTTEPNLNKVIVEREGAIGDDRIVELLREAVAKVAPHLAPFRVETGVTSSSDIVDEPKLVVGLLAFDLMVGAEYTDATRSAAEAILNQRGAAARANRNAVILVGADAQGIAKARQTARTLAAMRDIASDQTRLKRFNQEQKDQLQERRSAAEERLPQQLAMAYRHLLLLGSDGNGGASLDVVDLGPAKVNDTVPGRVLDHLGSTDRLLDTVLAPAALLTDRFGVLASTDEAVELDRLLAFFYRLPRLPKLASADVLRSCLVQGVESGTFGLASGASWNAPDAVLRFSAPVDRTEVQFQPGTWLVRAAAIKSLLEQRTPTGGGATPTAPVTSSGADGDVGSESTTETGSTSTTAKDPTRLLVRVNGVSADKIRDVIKVSVMPLAAAGADVSVTVEVLAESSTGIPRNTIDLVVKEGLRQLGVQHDVDDE
jgi:hypothetical protein